MAGAGQSQRIPGGSGRSSLLAEFRDPDASALTVVVSARAIATQGYSTRPVARVMIDFGDGSTLHGPLEADVSSGLVLSLPGSAAVVSIRNLGQQEIEAKATISPATRPASRPAVLTSFVEPITSGLIRPQVPVPLFATEATILRTDESPLRVEWLDPAAVVLAALTVSGNERPTFPVVQGATNLRLSIPGVADEAVASPVQPIVLWGLWV